MSIEYSEGLENLKKLVAEYSPLGELSNEAQTRFSFVDLFLRNCLGWEVVETKVEVTQAGERTDYECGSPRALIIEAKRSADQFKFPPRGPRSGGRIRLDSLCAFSDDMKDAILQAQKYCQSRGVELAAVSNASQLIIFMATRTDGRSPLAGDALVFDGYEEIVKNFVTVFDAISRPGVSEQRYRPILSGKQSATMPPKLSSLCIQYHDYSYSSDFQESLRNAASLVIEDLGRSDEVETEFLRECYCESGPISQYSMLGKNIVAARYAALFPSGTTGSKLEQVNPRNSRKGEFSEKVMAEALARRPLVLLGDVGVGKTSFLKHLMKVSASDVFKNVISIYFDLGSEGALVKETKDALLEQVENMLREDLGVNKMDAGMLESIYKVELREFDTGVMSQLRDINEASFQEKRLSLIMDLVSRRESHLKRVLSFVSKSRSAQIVFVIDNADQRSADVQTDAFVIAQELSAHWSSVVFIALRPQTFHASKRSGAVSAYPSKVFVIPPPKLEDAIDKRLVFAKKMAEGRLPIQSIGGVSLHLESLSILIDVLRNSISRNKDIMEFIVNVSSGNIRIAVELVSRFFGNPNVQSERIVGKVVDGNGYIIPVHEFAKTALLGDYSHFQESSSLASNVFDVTTSDINEHFLSLLILSFLSWDQVISGSVDGFVKLSSIVDEMQDRGFTNAQIESHLVRMNRKKLIESVERKTLELDGDIHKEGLPEAFRITTLGAYVSKKWVGDFSFLDAMSFDTPIFDSDVRIELSKVVNDDKLGARYIRASEFRDYLSDVWGKRNIQPPYFDWQQLVSVGADSFNRVLRRLAELGQAAK
jgi:GTPase SAR1 family protein